MSFRPHSFVACAAVALTLALTTSPSLAGEPVRPVARVDPVAESFVRMLTHEANRATPPVPGDTAVDPLIATVVWPLLRSNQITVAAVERRGAP